MRNVWLALAAALLISCVGESRLLEGREFDACAAEKLAPGETAERVRATVGEPFRVVPLGDGSEEWRYFVRAKRPRWIHVLSLQVQTGSMIARSEAVIRMRGGRVERVVESRPWVVE